MKEHAKNALKHDFEVAGKTIPTLAIAALFLVGTGSAALLSSFGTVSGTADVDQPIQLNGQNQNEVTSAYGVDTAVGGQTVSTSPQTVTNSLNSTITVGFETDIQNGSDGEWLDQSSLTGVDTAHLVYSQHDNDDGSKYAISVSKVAPISDGSNYAVHVGSEGVATTDYATVWYDVSGVDVQSKSDLSLDADIGDNHKHGGALDEVYAITESGDVHVTQATGAGQSLDLSSDIWWQSKPDLSNVVAIGLGYGDASGAKGVNDNSLVADVTIDNVRLGAKNVDEQADVELPVKANVSFGAYDYSQVEGNTMSRYKLQDVTTFDTAVIPQTYKTETSLVPQ